MSIAPPTGPATTGPPLIWTPPWRSWTWTPSTPTPTSSYAARAASRSASRASRCAAGRCCERVLARDGFAGVMSFTLAESLWLAARGSRHPAGIPVGGPRPASRLAADPRPAARGHGDGRRRRAARPDRRARAAAAGRRSGSASNWTPLAAVRRPAADRRAALAAARPGADGGAGPRGRRAAGFRLVGMMAYEGQIAGVGDAIAGRPLRSRAIRLMQSAARTELAARRAEVVAAVRGGRGRTGVRQRRRHRQRGDHRGRGRRHRDRGGLRAVCAAAVRQLHVPSTGGRRRSSRCRWCAGPAPAW